MWCYKFARFTVIAALAFAASSITATAQSAREESCSQLCMFDTSPTCIRSCNESQDIKKKDRRNPNAATSNTSFATTRWRDGAFGSGEGGAGGGGGRGGRN